jgi:hypothetical protein
VFFSAFGHIHTLDGSGVSRVPESLKAEAREAIESNIFTNRNFATQALKTKYESTLLKKTIDKALVAIKREPKKRKVDQSFEKFWSRIKFELKGNCALNSIPSEPASAMVVHRSFENFDTKLREDFAIFGTQQSFELALSCHTIHCDTTFKLIQHSDDKLFGIVVQDAAARIFPVAYMIGDSENPMHYKNMFKLLYQAWDIVRINNPSLPEPNILRVVFDGV